MKDILIGDTFGRSAYVNKNKNGYYVCLTDWTTRQGGSYSNLTLDHAIQLGKEFVSGSPYKFDSNRGIVLI